MPRKMRCMSFISMVLWFYLCALGYAATIPAESTLSNGFPSTNQSLAYKFLQVLDKYDSFKAFQDATVQTIRPWPAPPFNFRSYIEPTWLLRVVSYDPPRLTFRQLHAMVSLCHDTQLVLRTLDPDDTAEAKNYFFRSTAREPYDLTTQDVEVAIFNSPEEPGAAYKVIDIYTVLDLMLERMLPQDLPGMARTVVHYSELQPRHGPLLKFRRVKIQRKSDNSLASAVATA